MFVWLNKRDDRAEVSDPCCITMRELMLLDRITLRAKKDNPDEIHLVFDAPCGHLHRLESCPWCNEEVFMHHPAATVN